MHRIPVSETIFLSPPEARDIPAYVQWLNEKEIFDRTLMIPHPYAEEDARWFLDYCKESFDLRGLHTEWAIRDAQGGLLGGVGVHNFNAVKPHAAEIGYWLAKPHWGKGIMTQVVRTFSAWAMREMELLRLEAPVYAFNIASQRVLEKCGYKEEGYLRKAYFKNGQYQDGKLFALVI